VFPLLAQQAPGGGASAGLQPRTSAATLQVSTRLTIVPVVVMEYSGRPAKGLPQSALRVIDDGTPQQIRNIGKQRFTSM
jgi:hypothetical protein